jgi:hypothetical protein
VAAAIEGADPAALTSAVMSHIGGSSSLPFGGAQPMPNGQLHPAPPPSRQPPPEAQVLSCICSRTCGLHAATCLDMLRTAWLAEISCRHYMSCEPLHRALSYSKMALQQRQQAAERH